VIAARDLLFGGQCENSIQMITTGTPDQFLLLRESLTAAGYVEDEVCRRFGIESLESFEIERDPQQVVPWQDQPAGILTRLFLEGRYTPHHDLQTVLGTPAVEAITELGLLEQHPSDAGQVSATVALYPVRGVYVASDRWNRPDRGVVKPASDIVYPALVPNTMRFLRYMPARPCRAMLDLGTGTGIAALAGASEFAEKALALDIAPRSTLFAEWNRALNGLANMEVRTGDLYEPVRGEQFDRIVTHPPYVPVLRPKWIYHDGGQDGEQIVQRAVAGAAEHLAPGGLFYLLAMLSDRESEPVEARVRRWLGEASGEFDVLLCPLNSLDPNEFASRAALQSENPARDYAEFKRLMGSLGVTQMMYSVLLLQRRSEARTVFTQRREITRQTTPDELLSTVTLETELQTAGGLARLLRARVAANRETQLRVEHSLGEEGWEVGGYLLRVERPFSMEARTDAWAALLLSLADGNRTLSDCLRALQEQGALAPETPAPEFARAAGDLISGGFLRLV
jgi:SAM-dependent methyltransferase